MYSCGFLIRDKKTGKFLACHPTGNNKGYDIPKGCQEEGETYFECALRETKEETGLDISKDISVINQIEAKYISGKTLVVFLIELDISLDDLHCDSIITSEYQKGKPEVDKFVLTDSLDIYFKSLIPILRRLVI